MNLEYFRTIPLSFYSNHIYRRVLQNGVGYGIKYLFLVTIITSIITICGFAFNVTQISSEKIANFFMSFIISDSKLPFSDNLNRFINVVAQVPEVRIEGNNFKIDEKQPFFITDPVSGGNLAILDTSGTYKSILGNSANILLNVNKLIIKENDIERTVYIADLEKYHLDSSNINMALFVLAQIPLFELKGGKFQYFENKTYRILDQESNLLAEMGVDASLKESNGPILAISSDSIKIKGILGNDDKVIPVSELNEITLFNLIESCVNFFKKIFLLGLPILGLPVVIFLTFCIHVILVFLYGLICYSIIKNSKLEYLRHLRYDDFVRMATVAITPVMLIGAILPRILPSQSIIYFIVAIGYLYFAIKSNIQKI